jgi:ketosteroid isomerase-like protein
MARISSGIFNKWLTNYGQAWEAGDAPRAAGLFTEEAIYRVTPFDKPLEGRKAIQSYWQAGPGSGHKDVEFSYRIISVRGDEGIAHWQASFRKENSNIPVNLDGILIAKFEDSGLCTDFEEWWHRKETASEDPED